jgi:hypothetical protein
MYYGYLKVDVDEAMNELKSQISSFSSPAIVSFPSSFTALVHCGGYGGRRT